jgi:hypothetical protein
MVSYRVKFLLAVGDYYIYFAPLGLNAYNKITNHGTSKSR